MQILFTLSMRMMTVKSMADSEFDRAPSRRFFKQRVPVPMARPLHKRRGVGAGQEHF
jgi:hypothetical protein